VVDIEGAGDLLGRHVARGANDALRLGEVVGFCPGDRPGWGLATHDLRDAEVGNLYAALAIEENVLGFDVAVDDAAVVGELEPVTDLGDDGQRLRGRESPGPHGQAEVDAVDELHQQVEEAVGLAEVVDGDDVGVVESREGLRLPGESGGELWVLLSFWRQDLEGDQTVEGSLPRLVHDAHATAAKALQDIQLRELGCDVLGGGRGLCGNLGAGRGGFGGEVEGAEAAGAQVFRGVGRQGRPASGACGGWIFVHHPWIKRPRRPVTRI
jgi:hypothetical protein